MTLTFELGLDNSRYLQTKPTCQNSGLYVHECGQDSETKDGQTDTQTDNAKTITPIADTH